MKRFTDEQAAQLEQWLERDLRGYTYKEMAEQAATDLGFAVRWYQVRDRIRAARQRAEQDRCEDEDRRQRIRAMIRQLERQLRLVALLEKTIELVDRQRPVDRRLLSDQQLLRLAAGGPVPFTNTRGIR